MPRWFNTVGPCNRAPGSPRTWAHVLFDRRGGQPPIAERTHAGAAITPAGRQVTVVRD